MSARWLLFAGLAAWLGLTLLLAELRWFRRPSLADRIRPYVPGGLAQVRRGGLLSAGSFRDVFGPLATAAGERLARLFGVSEQLAVRLERVHAPLTVQAFRLRQAGWSLIAFTGAGLLVVAVHPPPIVALLFLLGAPLLAFLLAEQQAASASHRWQRRIFLELPVLSEQLGMLLGAGFSLGSAVQRLGQRGTGACAEDLRRVHGRVQQGLSDIEALQEWARLADVPALDRLVGVLALNREAGDLGSLISEEARAIRRDAQRELIEAIERRSQQVWIPVTVATLVPGVIFLAVPFLQAMQLFTND